MVNVTIHSIHGSYGFGTLESLEVSRRWIENLRMFPDDFPSYKDSVIGDDRGLP